MSATVATWGLFNRDSRIKVLICKILIHFFLGFNRLFSRDDANRVEYLFGLPVKRESKRQSWWHNSLNSSISGCSLTCCSLRNSSTIVKSSGMLSFSLAASRAWQSVNQTINSSTRAALVRTMRSVSCNRAERWLDRLSAWFTIFTVDFYMVKMFN